MNPADHDVTLLGDAAQRDLLPDRRWSIGRYSEYARALAGLLEAEQEISGRANDRGSFWLAAIGVRAGGRPFGCPIADHACICSNPAASQPVGVAMSQLGQKLPV
jgi:hypothetical protein